MKLELGKRYVMRNGLITGPMIRNRTAGTLYQFKARVYKLGWITWAENGIFLLDNIKRQLDIVREYKEPKKRPAASLMQKAVWYANERSGQDLALFEKLKRAYIAGARSVKK